ncbi:hypothetical protein [Anaerotignum sp.]
MKLDKETGREQFSGIKEWLRRYKYATDDLKSIQTRIEVLKDRMLSPSAPVLSDMPKGSSTDPDKIGRAYSVIDELEQEAAEEAERAKEIYREINKSIRQIRGNRTGEIRLVMQLRYLDLLPWEDISFTLYGDQEDFYDREQTYSRKTFLIHRQGLEALADIIDFETEE